MTAVSVTYIIVAKEGFKLPVTIGYPIGLTAAAALAVVYLAALGRRNKKIKEKIN